VLHRGDGHHGKAPAARALSDLDRNGGETADAEHDHHVGRLELEVREDDLGQPFHPLDEHRLPLAVGADDLRMEGHRELHDRVETGEGAVAREQLLDGDARVARAEGVDEAAHADRVGAQLARLRQGVRLRLLDPPQQRGRRVEEPASLAARDRVRVRLRQPV